MQNSPFTTLPKLHTTLTLQGSRPGTKFKGTFFLPAKKASSRVLETHLGSSRRPPVSYLDQPEADLPGEEAKKTQPAKSCLSFCPASVAAAGEESRLSNDDERPVAPVRGREAKKRAARDLLPGRTQA